MLPFHCHEEPGPSNKHVNSLTTDSSIYNQSILHTVPVIYKSGCLARHRSRPKCVSSENLIYPPVSIVPSRLPIATAKEYVTLHHLKTLKYATGLDCYI